MDKEMRIIIIIEIDFISPRNIQRLWGVFAIFRLSAKIQTTCYQIFEICDIVWVGNLFDYICLISTM